MQMMRGQRRPSRRGGAEAAGHPRFAVLLVMLATFMVILDTSMVTIALPHIGRDLGPGGGLEWVVTGSLLAMGVAQPITGWVGNRFGEKHAFLGSLGLFGVSSALVAAAPNMQLLVAGRVLQGVFGGLAMPLSAGLLVAMFPVHRRGSALGLSGAAVMVAPGLGPVLGGWIVSNASWRWIMLVNVPIALAGVVFGLRYVPEAGERRPRSFDGVGLVLVSGGLVALLTAISFGDEWGWSSPAFLGLTVAAVVLLAMFNRWSHRVESPLIDPRIMGDPVFRATILIVWAVSLAQFSRIVFVPLELQLVRGMGPFEAGLVLATAAVTASVAMPLAGRWTDRTGGRIPAIGGIAVLGIAMARLGTLTLDTPEWQVVVAVALTGMGTVLVVMPATVVGLNVVSGRLGQRFVSEAAAVRSLNRQVAGAVSTMVLAAVVVATTGNLDVAPANHAGLVEAQAAYNRVYVTGLVGLAAALVLARWLPGRANAPARTQRADLEAVLD